MTLEEYTPKQNYILIQVIKEKKSKGGIIIPDQVETPTPTAKVLKAGPKCENVIEGEIIVIDTMAYAKPVYLSDYPQDVFTCTEHVAVGGYIPKA